MHEQRNRSIFLRIWFGLLLGFYLLMFCPGLHGDSETGSVAGRFSINHLSIKNGLSQNTVNVILQDRYGFMWFGSRDGLNRYDGKEFRVFTYSPRNPESLSGNYITSLCEDHDGFLWIGTALSGINRFDPQTERFTRFQHELGKPFVVDHNQVLTIFEDHRGILWIGTQKGLERMDIQKQAISNYWHREGDLAPFNDKPVRSIAEDSSGNLWFGTLNSGLNRFDPITGTITTYLHVEGDEQTLPGNRISAIVIDHKGNFYLGTDRGVGYFNPCTGKVLQYWVDKPGNGGSPLSDNLVNTLRMDLNQSLWIGTFEGLNRLNCLSGKISHFRLYLNIPESITQRPIHSLYCDRYGNVWTGPYSDGIYFFSRQGSRFVTYGKEALRPGTRTGSHINAFFEDNRGILWIASDKGLSGFDRGTNRYTHMVHEPGNPNSLSENNILCFIQDHEGVFWLGTRNKGLSRWDPQQGGRFTHYLAEQGKPGFVSGNYITTIYEDHMGELWVGAQESGLSRLDVTRKKTVQYIYNPGDRSSISSMQVYPIFEDSEGVIWVGTQNGLNRFDRSNERFQHFLYNPYVPDSLSNNFVLSIHEDQQKRLWVGTMGGGINHFDRGSQKFTYFTTEDGLPNNVIYSILEDDDGFLWLATNQGLCRFDPNDHTCTNYDQSDGLQSNEFNYGAAFKSKTGELYFGGVNGFNAFYPRDIKPNPYPPPVVIIGFSLFNKPVDIGKGPDGRSILNKSISHTSILHLYHHDHALSFRFVALNYINPEQNLYAYKMEGFDDNWNNSGTLGQASYINLPPGEYTFRVKASNNDGVWNEEGTAIKIIIKPSFWQTWWFQGLLVTLFISTMVFHFSRRNWKIRQQQKKLEEMVEQRTCELHREREVAEKANQSKSQFLARMSHEIRTPMNAVIGFTDILMDTHLEENQKDYVQSIQQSGQSLLGLIDDILDFSKIEAGQMTLEMIDFDPEITIYDICELITPRLAGKSINLLCHIDDHIPPQVKTDPGKYRQVILNLVGNAIKFTEKGEIEIFLGVEEEKENHLKLHIRVKDTGIGIAADKLESIFEVFQQADGSTTRRYGGTGLGLAICKQIAVLMGGEVWVESELGKGSIFHFTAWVEKSQEKTPIKIVTPHLDGKRILVVDDNPKNLDVIRHQLEHAGIKITGLTDGISVLSTLFSALEKGNPFDMCILDIQLPDKSGYKILEDIRRQGPPVGTIPVLAFSSSTLNRSRRFHEAGFDGFLPRPIHKKKLLDMVSRLLATSLQPGTVQENKPAPPAKEPLITRYTLMEEAKHSVTILLAEDNVINQKLARFLLMQAGYQVDIANNGQEAVDIFTAAPGKYDLILMDIQMPVMDGKKATQLLRQKGFTSVPIIAVTADARKEEKENILAAGLNDYITKPLKRELIFQIVKKWTITDQ